MQKYRVEIDDVGTVRWFKFGTNERHRLDGPAIERADGSKEWWIEGKKLTETEFLNRTKPAESCDGREVVIDGKTYTLKAKE